MPKIDLSSVVYGGSRFNSVALVDKRGDLRVAPSMYLSNLRVNGSSANTLQNYAYHLDTFFKVLDYSQLDWRDVTQQAIDIYLNRYLSEELGLTEKSIKPHIAALSGFFEYAFLYGFTETPLTFSYRLGIAEKPANTNKNAADELIEHFIPRDKFETLLGAVDEQSDYLQERNELTLCLGYYMGLRAAEVVDPRNLKRNKIFKNGEVSEKITIIGKGEKQRSVTIPYPIKEKVKSFITGRLQNIPGNLLISSDDGSPLNRAFASKLFLKAARNSGDHFFNQRGFHSLRHTFATNLVSDSYERGHDPWVVVPDQMGHADLETTFGYVFFEAVLSKRHSLLKKLSIKNSDIRKKKWVRKTKL